MKFSRPRVLAHGIISCEISFQVAKKFESLHITDGAFWSCARGLRQLHGVRLRQSGAFTSTQIARRQAFQILILLYEEQNSLDSLFENLMLFSVLVGTLYLSHQLFNFIKECDALPLSGLISGSRRLSSPPQRPSPPAAAHIGRQPGAIRCADDNAKENSRIPCTDAVVASQDSDGSRSGRPLEPLFYARHSLAETLTGPLMGDVTMRLLWVKKSSSMRKRSRRESPYLRMANLSSST
jgi:hypothetical protein